MSEEVDKLTSKGFPFDIDVVLEYEPITSDFSLIGDALIVALMNVLKNFSALLMKERKVTLELSWKALPDHVGENFDPTLFVYSALPQKPSIRRATIFS